jgi:hypothetical protein
MPALPDDSALWAYGRVGPRVLTRFNVQQLEVADGTYFEAILDLVAVWQHPRSTFARSVEESRDFLDLVVWAYAVRTGVALDFTFDGWVEATNAKFDGAVIGTMVDRRGHRPHLDESAKKSVDMRSAVELAAAVLHRGGWRLAVRDIYAAARERDRGSDDCFVFAFRAVEDLAHAASTSSGKDWSALHALLGTDKARFMRRIEALRLARNAAAHGDESDPELATARANRKALVTKARRIVRDAIQKAPTLPTV